MANAAYNFVPVSNQVFFPAWSKQISYDLPFSDGESGSIDIEITAISPLFIRNSNEKRDVDSPAEDFFQSRGQHFIPGTSLKGMIRNMVEIISYGKLKPVENGRYSVREIIQNSQSYDLINQANQIRGGFLYRENGRVYIRDAGKPGRISHQELDDKLGTGFVNSFRVGGVLVKNNSIKKDEFKTGAHKYKMLEDKKLDTELVYRFERVTIEAPEDNVKDKREFYSFAQEGRKGRLVFTGQPSPRMQNRNGRMIGKFFEFIFFEEPDGELMDVTDKIKDFEFINTNHTKGEPSADWKYWRPKFMRGEEIPVFFRSEEVAGKLQVLDFGIPFMYKQAYNYTVHDLLFEEHFNSKPDLAECLFGPVLDDRDCIDKFKFFKGRVQFGHAKAIGAIKTDDPVETILGGPSASFYPFYLQQDGQEVSTYQKKGSSLAGWKRYPVHTKVKPSDRGNENEKILAAFIPIVPESKFKSSIHLHNLRKAEIGSLLSALTFHGNDSCFHSLGMAKAKGYGKVKIKVVGINNLKFKTEDYYRAFESLLTKEAGLRIPSWGQFAAYCELMTMAAEQNQSVNDNLVHMSIKQFGEVKNNINSQRPALPRYTKIPGVQKQVPQTYFTEEFLAEQRAAEQARLDEIKALEEAEKERKRQLEEEKVRIEKEKEAQLKAQRREQLAEEGLRAMLDKISKIDYNQISRRIDDYIKKLKISLLSETDDLAAARENLEALYNLEKEKKKTLQQWIGDLGQSPRWKKISTWVGPEIAQEWQKSMME